MKADLVSNSPIVSVDEKELTSRADVTLDTFLNTLPQVNPAGTTTSNNPGNSGQSNINLRGLGSNRNLVLVDGRRVMPSASNMTVDLNTIPSAMIEGIEVISGGAGAAYGADAVSGAVNIKLKRNFEGLEFKFSNSNHLEERDAKENNFSLAFGGNFDDDKGNAVFGFDFTERQALIKAQRPFAAIATSTTTFFPEGLYFSAAGNHPTQTAVDSVFAQYGVAAGKVPASSSLMGFNADGTLFSRGLFNNQNVKVENWKYPVDLSVNTNLFPDMYSYNFDEVNILVLPLERKAFSNKMDYQLTDKVKVFSSVSWTNYESITALAPTPFPTVSSQGPGGTSASMVNTSLLEPGKTVANLLVIPHNNPFIPADLRKVLDSRTGDNANLAGAGANEAFTIRSRSLWGGLRESVLDNTVLQYMLGFSGEINDAWRWDAYAMEGKTTIRTTQTGNLQTQRIQTLVESSLEAQEKICKGGYNPFGRQALSQECIDYILIDNTQTNELNQRIVQGYVSGDLFELESGMVSTVLGMESRKFSYEFDPGALSGPVSGLNTQSRAEGTNEFVDIFAEAYIPLLDSAAFADLLDLTLGYRTSQSEFVDEVKKLASKKDRNNALKAELSWTIADGLPRLRASYQKAVRAPNFSELFDAGASAPQYFDPCSVGTDFRKTTGAAGAALCQATGIADPAIFAQSPGGQTNISISGNVELKAESADTITLGAVHNFDSGVVAALDYYSIDIEDAIISPNSNLVIADCYNYYGNNSQLSSTYDSCRALTRNPDIGSVRNLSNPSGAFQRVNSGFIKTSGIDFQTAYRYDSDLFGGSTLNTDLYVNYLLSYETKELPSLPAMEYSGTIAYFGAGLGQSFPEFKANLNSRLTIGDFEVALRARYIGSMVNRLNAEFPIETSPTGVGSVTYWDSSVSYNFAEGMMFRLGLNNMFDKQPPVYAPNVQSGTDPSLYDVIGRRYTATVQIKF
jgi:outer membrane receptor protein involved in Fe transport